MNDSKLEPRNNPLSIGDLAPDFTLTDQARQPWQLAEAVRKGDVILCFYPMDFSPICSSEMRCVSDSMAQWAATGAEVVGISCDSFFVHAAWAESLGLKHTLLADMHRQVCKAYGFYFEPMNVSSRGTIIIAQSDDGVGRVKWVQARELKQAMEFNEIIAEIS